jgi:two-component system response regulator YesN
LYRLVIVEDERDVRKRLVGMIERAGGAFELVAEYENGVDAYESVLTDNPDLIITDIRVPYINGIELSKKVRDVLPLCKIIIITGYSEFDYAREAANLGVMGFVSKPITPDAVAALLEKTRVSLDGQYVTAESLSRLEDFYHSSLPVIRENDLCRLSGMNGLPPELEKKPVYNRIDLAYEFFLFCLFDLDEAQAGREERHELAFPSIRGLVVEAMGSLWDFELFSRYDKLCLMIKSHTLPDTSEIERRLEKIILRHSDVSVSVGISNVHRDHNFATMRREAMRALEYRSVMGGRKAFFYGNTATPSQIRLIDDESVRELGYLLRFRPEEEYLAVLGGLRHTLEGVGMGSYYYALTGILNVLIKACDDLGSLYLSHGGQEGIYRRLFEIRTTGEAFAFFGELSREIRTLNDGVLVEGMERNLHKVLSYMDAHYCDADLSFESLAGEIGFSVSYISALLKKKMGTSFVRHLTALRMERARELLRGSGKIVEVAEQLGYSDPYYFSHCFKRYTGLSPREYRGREPVAAP